MTNDNILFLIVVAGAVAFLAISFVLSRRRRDKEMFVRSQYFVILILGVTVINAICERLFG
jgi:LPXTG-motif cell wall-anchored protein